MAFKQGDLVYITRLGGPDHDAKKYLGKVCGLSVDGVIRIYIVEVSPENPLPGQGDWSHVTIPESCLDLVIRQQLGKYLAAEILCRGGLGRKK